MSVAKQWGSGVSPRDQHAGWMLLAVMLVVLLTAIGVVMLMTQAQVSLRSVRQEHQALQESIDQWPSMLNHRAYADEE